MVVLTDRRQANAPLPEVVAAAVAGGARWVLLREKDLPRVARLALAEQLRSVLAPAGGRLIVAGPDPLGGDAIHLSADCMVGGGGDIVGRSCHHAGERQQCGPGALATPGIVGRSCHHAEELDQLNTEDYVTLSPVFPSASKPGYGPPLGLAGLRALCRRTDRPVLALGGIETPAQAAACVAAGAAGVAVMGAVMRAADPAAVTARVCEALGPIAVTVSGWR